MAIILGVTIFRIFTFERMIFFIWRHNKKNPGKIENSGDALKEDLSMYRIAHLTESGPSMKTLT